MFAFFERLLVNINVLGEHTNGINSLHIIYTFPYKKEIKFNLPVKFCQFCKQWQAVL